jgi:multidrug efflux system membrane fusion protein
MQWSRRIWMGAALAALLAICGCAKKSTQAAGPPSFAPLVTVAQARAQDVPVYLEEIGRSGAFESVTVTPQISGRIVERHFEDGAQLKKDQLLFVIDPRPYQAQLDSVQAQLAQSKAALDLAKTQLKMYDSIANTRAVSQLDVETKKNTVAVDEAQVQANEAAVEQAKLNLDYCYIHSPIDGRAGMRLVDVGNVVQTNATGLLLIQRLDPIYADFTVTEADLPEVQRQLARGTLHALVRIPSDPPNKGREGQLTFVDNQVQNATGTVSLRATINNSDHHFWPGQFVNVTLVLATAKGAVLIPNQASQISQQGPYVYVVKADNTAELRMVALGQRQGDDVVVTKGVAAGESVIVTGQLTVAPGGKVTVQQSSPAPQSAPPGTTPANRPPGEPGGAPKGAPGQNKT